VNRSTLLPLIGVVLVGYGIYTALYVPGMLVGPPAPVLLLGFIAEAVFAIAAGVGVWTRQQWAGTVVLLLAASIAITALWEGFVLGIEPWLRALVVAVLAIVLGLVLAPYVSRPSDAG
jgi:hypothetical protein